MRNLFTRSSQLVAATLSVGSLVACSSVEEPDVGDDVANATESTLHSFSCETQWEIDGVVNALDFQVKGLGKPKTASIVFEDEGDAINVLPADSALGGINTETDVQHSKGKLKITGESGTARTEIVLYENSDYQKGYTRVVDPDGVVGGDRYVKVDCTVSEKKPRYRLDTEHLLGSFRNQGQNTCYGSYSECEDAELREEDGKVVLVLGEGDYWDGKVAEVWQGNGILLFSTGERYEYGGEWDDCDDPGCGNVLRIDGIIYPKKVDGEWVPTIKSYTSMEYFFPDEEDAPEGEYKFKNYLSQVDE